MLCLLSFVGTFMATLGGPLGPIGEGARQMALAGDGYATYLSLSLGTAGFASWCWSIGVLCMAVRFALQCHGAQCLKTTAISTPDACWQRAFQSLKEELGISPGVRLLRSGLAQVPMVVGWFSPIVLVPTSAFTGLSPDQLRSLLAHELAHIRRHDHLLNAAQAVVEIVLFFHPIVWWISKQVRLEREYCCDDSSVRLTGDARLLAEALAALETLRIQNPTTHAVLAANGGPLMKRIKRILGARLDGRTSLTSWHLPVGFVLAGLLAVAGNAYAAPNLIIDDDQAVAQDDLSAEARKVLATHEKMVKAGKMTEAQAKERFAAWKKHNAEQQSDRVNPKKVWAELEAAVKAGKMTEAQAKERFAGLQARLAKQKDNSEVAQAVRAELKAAVKAGRITEAQAKARFADWKKKTAIQKNDRTSTREVWAKLQAAVKAGKLTDVQAREEMGAYMKRLEQREPARKKQNPEAMIKEIAAAVEAGRISPEEGKAKIEAYKLKRAENRAAQEKALEGMIQRLKAAVESGKMTPAEAKQALAGYRQRIAGGSNDAPRAKMDVKGVIKRINAAVESGRITPEQGEERLKAYKERLSDKDTKKKSKKKLEKSVEKSAKKIVDTKREF